MASILLAVDGSSRTMLAASPSVIAATGSGGVSLSAAREPEVSGAEVGELMLTVSLLSFDQRRLNGFVIVIPGLSRGKRRTVSGRHLYFPGVDLVTRRGPALLTPLILVSLLIVPACSNSNASASPQKVAQQAEELPPASATPDPSGSSHGPATCSPASIFAGPMTRFTRLTGNRSWSTKRNRMLSSWSITPATESSGNTGCRNVMGGPRATSTARMTPTCGRTAASGLPTSATSG